MKKYKEFQFGWLIILVVLGVECLLAILFVFNIGTRPFDGASFGTVVALCSVILLLFYGMTITVDQQKITIRFGIGLISRSIALSKVEEITPVVNPWHYGWGIRYIPQGKLYNISGYRGVELQLNGSKEIIRIGTSDPERLKKVIEKYLSGSARQ